MDPASAQEALAKLRARQARQLRVAAAEGMLNGVVSMLRPGDVVFDCGANRGDITARLAATGAEVHAFEPDPYNIDKLRQRFKAAANVHLHEAAVGVAAGKLRLLRAGFWDKNPDLASYSSTVIPGGRLMEFEGSIEVEVLDFPAVLRDFVSRGAPPVFIKLDIEGAELDILERMLADNLFDHVRLTVAETHERKFRALKLRFAALRAAIAERYPITRVNLEWI